LLIGALIFYVSVLRSSVFGLQSSQLPLRAPCFFGIRKNHCVIGSMRHACALSRLSSQSKWPNT
jgi:hypothetical protein